MVTLSPPISKSDAQRALVLADILNLPFETILPAHEPWPRDVRVLREGLLRLRESSGEPVDIDCQDGGAPFRFLLTQAALAWGHTTRFFGSPRLGARPHEPLVKALRESLGPWGFRLEEGQPWPMTVVAPSRPAAPVNFDITGVESSQFASSLLLGAARLAQHFGMRSEVRVHGALTSVGYLELTRRWVERAGFGVTADGGCWTVEPARGVPSLHIPGDWSSLTYLLALAWKSGAQVERVDFSVGHPDEAFVSHLESVGLRVQRGSHVTVGGEASGGFHIDAEVCPDAVPTLAAVAAILPGESEVRRVGILRHKESDRLAAIREMLELAGCTTTLENEVLRIVPGPLRAFSFDAKEDHRMAMSAAVLAYLGGIRLFLQGKESVAKSFPRFWDELQKVSDAGALVAEQSLR